MGEIIFEKSRKNLKKVYNRINRYSNVARVMGQEEVLFLAIGGYNRTYELIRAMGLKHDDIATFSNLSLTPNFLLETHMKQAIYIRKINYVTSVVSRSDYSKKSLDLNIADSFEESMLIYKTANRKIKQSKGWVDWVKPTIIILDDQSLNLQYGGHRFYYQSEIGFVQVRNRNTHPDTILAEIANVEEVDKMMFALYQDNGADETEVLDALNRLRVAVERKVEEEWYLKPTEFKKIVGSNELATAMREMSELSIHQLKSNKKIGKENARWIVVPEKAFEFKGFNYKDEDEIFNEELENEMASEEKYAAQREELLNSIMFEEFPLNIKIGWIGNNMNHSTNESLHSFIADIDGIEQEQVNGIELLSSATTEDEYKYIKKHHLAYFLDGEFDGNERTNENYKGGKRLVSIDIDDGNYTREEIENKLEMQGLFGLVYPTAKYYYDGSPRWRILMMADNEMNKEQYKAVVEGIGLMLDIEIDEASQKIAQLMGYPLAQKDISIVIGTRVNVEQFKPKQKPKFKPVGTSNIVEITHSKKSLTDFNHKQADLLRQALTSGIPDGQRNESYRQIMLFLRDVQNNSELKIWHREAMEYEAELEGMMMRDGLDNKEMELIMR